MKSHVSTLLELAKVIIIDAFAKCVANEPADRDIDTLISRVEHEGLSFITITLPNFSANFERSLADQYVDPKYFPGFRKYRRIPAFLRGIFGLVFDAGTGRILNEPSVEAIESIRQICLAFKKLKLACTPTRVDKAFSGYVKDEQALQVPLAQGDIDRFLSVSDLLWESMSECPCTFDMLPKHGPGATAERIQGNAKYRQLKWHDRLERYFPYDSFALSSINALESEEFKQLSVMASDQELPVRVITVPKTLKGPRIIAIEPVCMQYIQQAISRVLVEHLESHPLTAGHVNFTNQSVNRGLAIIASKDSSMATLDLSAASDRVPLSLASSMFRKAPILMDAILACRSTHAQLPSGVVLHLRKFASMGSALCFPVESMYFYTICVAALLERHNLPVTRAAIRKVAKLVYVYGDDIIIPADDATTVIDHLQKYYCKVNMPKSFWTGKFRESCGMDAFNGEEVTPTYVREMPPDDRQSSNALISWVATSNLFYKKGYWRTSSYMVHMCERLLGKLPLVGQDSAALGKVSFQRFYSIERWSSRYHCPEVRAWIASPVYRTDKLDGYPALLKCLLNMEGRPFSDLPSDVQHLSRTARHGAVALKRRWTRPY